MVVMRRARAQTGTVVGIWRWRRLLAVSDGLWGSGCGGVVRHGRITSLGA